MPTEPTPGRSLVTKRAIIDVVRAATLGSYGVAALGRGRVRDVVAALAGGERGIRLDLRDGLAIDLELTVAYGLPIAEVARQVDSAVRYAVRRSVGRDVDRLTIRVNGLAVQPGGQPPRPGGGDGPRGRSPAEVPSARDG